MCVCVCLDTSLGKKGSSSLFPNLFHNKVPKNNFSGCFENKDQNQTPKGVFFVNIKSQGMGGCGACKMKTQFFDGIFVDWQTNTRLVLDSVF